MTPTSPASEDVPPELAPVVDALAQLLLADVRARLREVSSKKATEDDTKSEAA